MTARKTAKKADEVEKLALNTPATLNPRWTSIASNIRQNGFDEQNYPFAHHVETVIARLQNK